MTTFLTLHANRHLYAHGNLTAKTNLILGESAADNKFKIDLADGGDKDTLKTSLASTFSGTVSTTAQLTATGGVDVKSTLTVKDSTNTAKLTVTPGSTDANAFYLDLNADLKQKLNVDGDTTLGKLTADGNVTVESTGTLRAEGNTDLRGVVTYASGDNGAADTKFILDHTKSGDGQYGLVCDMKSEFSKLVKADSLDVTGNTTFTGRVTAGDIACENIVVSGTMTTVNSTEVNVGDSHMHLNSSNIATSAINVAGGIVVNCEAIHSHEVESVSQTTFTLVGDFSNLYDGGDIVQISGWDSNIGANGLYIVDSKPTLSRVVLKNRPGVDFCKKDVPDGVVLDTDTIQMTKVKVGHVKVDSNGLTYASGHNKSNFAITEYYDFKDVITSNTNAITTLQTATNTATTTAAANTIDQIAEVSRVMNHAPAYDAVEKLTLGLGQTHPTTGRVIVIDGVASDGTVMNLPSRTFVQDEEKDANGLAGQRVLRYRLYNNRSTAITISPNTANSSEDPYTLDGVEAPIVLREKTGIMLTYINAGNWATI